MYPEAVETAEDTQTETDQDTLDASDCRNDHSLVSENFSIPDLDMHSRRGNVFTNFYSNSLQL